MSQLRLSRTSEGFVVLPTKCEAHLRSACYISVPVQLTLNVRSNFVRRESCYPCHRT